MVKKHWIAVVVAGVVLAGGLFAWSRSAASQPYGPGMMGGGGWGPGMMGGNWGPGFMMGPGMMGGRGNGHMCNPGAAGFTEWRVDRLADLIKPNDEQRAKLDDLKRASVTAAEAMRKTCTADIPETVPARMKAMEDRMETMLQAVKVVRPAMEAFYAALNDDQKRKLDNNSGRSRYWRYRENW